MPGAIAYSDRYKEQAYQVWFAAGCPAYRKLEEILPPDEQGRIPHHDIISEWAEHGGWAVRKETMLAEASKKMELVQIDETVEMWKGHAEGAKKVAFKALRYLEDHDFDSSASAVQAIKWAQEEERKTRGAEKFFTLIKEKTSDELMDMVRELAERSSETDDAIEGETKD